MNARGPRPCPGEAEVWQKEANEVLHGYEYSLIEGGVKGQK